MEELIEYIELLESQSFVCWSEEAENGYRTAMGSVKAKIKEIQSRESEEVKA